MVARAASRLASLARRLVQPYRARLRGSQRMSDIPPDFLIVGLQKCGTYWLTAMLNAHPEITSFPDRPQGAGGVTEGHFFDTLALLDSDPARFRAVFSSKHDYYFNDLARLAGRTDRETLYHRFRQRYNSFVQEQKRPGARLVGDKTTEYVFCLPLIESLYPGIKKICILRDPRDRIVSFHFHQRRKERWSHAGIATWEVEQYLQRVDKEFEALMAFDGDICLLTYEGLSASPIAQAVRLARYLGASTDEASVQQMVEASAFENLAGRLRGQDDPGSHFRKGLVGDWRLHLSPEQAALAEARVEAWAGPLRSRYGLDLSNYARSAEAQAAA